MAARQINISFYLSVSAVIHDPDRIQEGIGLIAGSGATARIHATHNPVMYTRHPGETWRPIFDSNGLWTITNCMLFIRTVERTNERQTKLSNDIATNNSKISHQVWIWQSLCFWNIFFCINANNLEGMKNCEYVKCMLFLNYYLWVPFKS